MKTQNDKNDSKCAIQNFFKYILYYFMQHLMVQDANKQQKNNSLKKETPWNDQWFWTGTFIQKSYLKKRDGHKNGPTKLQKKTQ